MKTRLLIIAALSLGGCASVFGQSNTIATRKAPVTERQSTTIVGSSAKIALETFKFTAKEFVFPVAKVVVKTIVLRAAPKISVFMVKESAKAAEKAIPIASKLFVKYIKCRLTP